MNKELIEMQIEINVHAHEIHELTKSIKEIDEMIVEGGHEYMTENELREHMHTVIDEYKKKIDKTRILLEAYFAEEEKAGAPTEFVLRKFYKKLKEAY